MSLDEHVRAVSRALRTGALSDSDREMLSDSVFEWAPPHVLVALGQSKWQLLSKEEWSKVRDAFYAESSRRDQEMFAQARLEREREAEERRARDAQRQRDFEAQAIVVPLAAPSAPPKQQAWSQYDKLFGQIGETHHATMPAGYGPREVNSLRAYLKRHFPRLAVSTRANPLGNETYVYRRGNINR